MKVRALSDQHGFLPEVDPCELLVIAGDICPPLDNDPKLQAEWLDTDFRSWLEGLNVKHVVGVAGNHDFVFLEPELVPTDLPWTYLQDTEAEVAGLRIYGTPWTTTFGGWAFEGDDFRELRFVYRLIPSGLDILVTHMPPYGYGDRSLNLGLGFGGGERQGSKALLNAIDRAKPRLNVFGHVHEGHGRWQRNETTLANVSILDHRYRWQHPATEFDVQRPDREGG